MLMGRFLAKISVPNADLPNFSVLQLPPASVDFRRQLKLPFPVPLFPILAPVSFRRLPWFPPPEILFNSENMTCGVVVVGGPGSRSPPIQFLA